MSSTIKYIKNNDSLWSIVCSKPVFPPVGGTLLRGEGGKVMVVFGSIHGAASQFICHTVVWYDFQGAEQWNGASGISGTHTTRYFENATVDNNGNLYFGDNFNSCGEYVRNQLEVYCYTSMGE